MKQPLLILSALVACSLLSCSVRQDVSLNADGSGEAVVRVTVQKFFASYLLDLAEFSGTLKSRDAGIFDPQEIRRALEQRPGVSVKSLAVPEPERLEMTLAFRSVDDLLSGEQALAESGILRFSSDGGTKRLVVHLDRENYAQISSLFPGTDDALLMMFGPQKGVSISEAEYLEMMEFTLGEEGPKAIKESVLEASVTVKGKLVSQKGGQASGATVRFTIPLLKLLLLDDPLDYEVVFN